MIGEHLIIAPILIPFVAGALMLLYDDRQRQAKFWLSLVSVAAQLLIAVELVVRAKTGGDISDAEGISFYLLGDWSAPYGIVLVLDRLAAMMLVLTAIVISFATTALFLVVMIASRGMTGTDHVDGKERSQ